MSNCQALSTVTDIKANRRFEMILMCEAHTHTPDASILFDFAVNKASRARGAFQSTRNDEPSSTFNPL